MTFAKHFFEMNSRTPIDVTNMECMPIDHQGVTHIVFSDRSAIVMRDGVGAVESQSSVASAFEDGKAGVERSFPEESAEALAYKYGNNIRASNSPEAKARLKELMGGNAPSQPGLSS